MNEEVEGLEGPSFHVFGTFPRVHSTCTLCKIQWDAPSVRVVCTWYTSLVLQLQCHDQPESTNQPPSTQRLQPTRQKQKTVRSLPELPVPPGGVRDLDRKLANGNNSRAAERPMPFFFLHPPLQVSFVHTRGIRRFPPGPSTLPPPFGDSHKHTRPPFFFLFPAWLRHLRKSHLFFLMCRPLREKGC